MSHNGLSETSISLIRYGKSYMPYEVWEKKFERGFFYDLVEEGIRPILSHSNYYISMDTVELGDRISFWAWELYAYEKSGKKRKITSLDRQGTGKTREQFISYEAHITQSEWHSIFDAWETECLFLTSSIEGMKQRYKLPDFLWKLIEDDNWIDTFESDEEGGVEKKKETSVHELGWTTNNRRNC